MYLTLFVYLSEGPDGMSGKKRKTIGRVMVVVSPLRAQRARLAASIFFLRTVSPYIIIKIFQDRLFYDLYSHQSDISFLANGSKRVK